MHPWTINSPSASPRAVEESLLLTEFERRGVNAVRFDDRHLQLDLLRPSVDCDVVIERCINHLRALYTLKVLNDWGVPTVNTYEVANTCGDKLLTTTALVRDGVPSPRTIIAFTPKRRWMRLKRSAIRSLQAGRRFVGPVARG